MLSQSTSLAVTATLLATVSAHGHVSGVVANGVYNLGYDPAFAYANPIPKVAGWTAQNLDNGFVSPDSFGSPDIICHKSATPGQAYINVAAGSKMTIEWTPWPDTHKGPVIDYLADCKGDCTTVDKTALQWVKIDQSGLLSGSNPGTWATDTLIANNQSWTSTVPSSLQAGNYVLRHEIIALHSAGSPNGAQAYPQCLNLKVTGSGTTALSGGTLGTKLYSPTDPGILFNLYTAFTSYTIPGPALVTIKKMRRHARDLLGFEY